MGVCVCMCVRKFVYFLYLYLLCGDWHFNEKKKKKFSYHIHRALNFQMIAPNSGDFLYTIYLSPIALCVYICIRYSIFFFFFSYDVVFLFLICFSFLLLFVSFAVAAAAITAAVTFYLLYSFLVHIQYAFSSSPGKKLNQKYNSYVCALTVYLIFVCTRLKLFCAIYVYSHIRIRILLANVCIFII